MLWNTLYVVAFIVEAVLILYFYCIDYKTIKGTKKEYLLALIGGACLFYQFIYHMIPLG